MVQIHETALVDDGAQIGEGTRIWHWVHVCSRVRIGRNCSLGQNVYVGNDVSIGNNVKIQNNVSVYDTVTLEDDVFCGPSMVLPTLSTRVLRLNERRVPTNLVKQGATLGANHDCRGGRLGNLPLWERGGHYKDVSPFALMVSVPARQVGWISVWG